MRHKCAVTTDGPPGNPASMYDQDVIDLLELQRLTRERLDHLMAMLTVEEVSDLLREMADGLETAKCDEGIGSFRRN